VDQVEMLALRKWVEPDEEEVTQGVKVKRDRTCKNKGCENVINQHITNATPTQSGHEVPSQCHKVQTPCVLGTRVETEMD
jgi:hypothetical protein